MTTGSTDYYSVDHLVSELAEEEYEGQKFISGETQKVARRVLQALIDNWYVLPIGLAAYRPMDASSFSMEWANGDMIVVDLDDETVIPVSTKDSPGAHMLDLVSLVRKVIFPENLSAE